MTQHIKPYEECTIIIFMMTSNSQWKNIRLDPPKIKKSKTYIHTLGSLLSSCLAISSSEGRPPAVTSEARVKVQYDSLLLLAADMVDRCVYIRSTALQMQRPQRLRPKILISVGPSHGDSLLPVRLKLSHELEN